MQFFILASGSKGNCILIKTENANILIDCGISLKRIKEKLKEHNLKIEDINGVLVTHGHNDHIKSLNKISEITKIYLSKLLYLKLIKKNNFFKQNIFVFTNKDKFYIKDIFVQVVPVIHDCVDPVGFVIYADNKKIGIFTDIGKITDEVMTALDKCSILLIEANHDIEMLVNCDRPWFLKDRILCNKGHLSNRDAGYLISNIYNKKYLEEVVLMHLSEDCNCKETALKTIYNELENKNIKFFNIKVALSK